MREEDNIGINVDEADLGQTSYHHLGCISGLIGNVYRTQLFKLYLRIVLRDDRRIGCRIRSHTTGMERTQRQLCTRLTDGLGGNHTDRLAFLYHPARSQVAAIALHADSLTALASQYGTDFHALNRRIFDFLCLVFRDFLPGGNNQLTRRRIDNIMHGHTSEDTFVK